MILRRTPLYRGHDYCSDSDSTRLRGDEVAGLLDRHGHRDGSLKANCSTPAELEMYKGLFAERDEAWKRLSVCGSGNLIVAD